MSSDGSYNAVNYDFPGDIMGLDDAVAQPQASGSSADGPGLQDISVTATSSAAQAVTAGAQKASQGAARSPSMWVVGLFLLSIAGLAHIARVEVK